MTGPSNTESQLLQHLASQVKASEKRLSLIIERSPDAYVIVDDRGMIQFVNRAAVEMFGVEERALLERPFGLPIVVGETTAVDIVRPGGKGLVAEMRVVETDWADKKAHIAVLHDITERKRAEAEHEKTQAKLRLAAEVARLGFWEWAPRTNEVYFSPEWKKQLGYGADELPDRFEEFASRLHPDDRANTLTAQLDFTGTAEPVLEMEYRLWHKAGGYRWIAARMVRIHDEAGRLTRLLGTHLDITEHKEIEERVRQISLHDPLTGLPNRALLYEFAEHLLSGARREGKCSAFLFVDLDRFKPINDTFGHAVGDSVLKEVANRLRQCVRGSDLVARLGGDEFLVVLPHVSGEEDAAKAAVHALESLRRGFHVDDLELTVTPSIGIAMFPHDGERVDELIKNADTAMYQVKENRKNDFQFFRRELNEHAQEALRLESRLRSGLAQQEFVLFYQAVMDTETGAVVGAEALLRWPAMQVGPGQFIPVAEKAGFMSTLGEWVVREACRQQREWRDNGLPSFPVAVNVSPLQFRDKHFARRVRNALADAGLAADDLRLEMTESTVMRDVEEATRILDALRELGVKVALDDFGTGYSSLSHLSVLPIDILKLDPSFVQGVGRNGACLAVAEAILALGKSLGLEIVAEGVESADALDYLRTRQCRRAQGFYFCQPMPAAEFEEWFRGR